MDKIFQFFLSASIFIYWLVIAAITIRIVAKRRALGVSIAWLMIIYILPVLGVMLYLLFGELNLGKKRAERARAMFSPYRQWLQVISLEQQQDNIPFSEFARPIHDLCLSRAGIPALINNQLSLHADPSNILERITHHIEQAQTTIDMTFYIWYPGGLVDKLALALCGAAKRGVKVKIALDSAGSKHFFKSDWPSVLRQSGIELVEALAVSPLRMFFRRLDIRQHRKLVIIDNLIGYTGSMNMVDPRFFKQHAGVGQWVDIMVEIQGPVVPILHSIFAWDWEVETGIRHLPDLPTTSNCFSNSSLDDCFAHSVQITPSGPAMPDGIIQQVLMLAIHQAKRNLTITTPYLVPSENLLSALQTAAQRGVEVNLIIPAKNDNMMVEWASRSFFTDLLQAGVNIYRFEHGLLHTKSVMIDEHFCLIGTVNLDMRSLWLNFELTLCIDDPVFCSELSKLQQQYIAQSSILTLYDWQQRPVYYQPIEQFFYLFSPLL